MSGWSYVELSEVHREELLREAERGRLVRTLREMRRAGERSSDKDGSCAPRGIKIRRGLPEDEPRIAELLELNGMPRRAAFEKRYIVAEKEGVVFAALRYRTKPEMLVLEILVADPWVEERPLALALYAGARDLAREIGAKEVRAWVHPYLDYSREVGYRRRWNEWRTNTTRAVPVREAFPAKGWWNVFGALGAPLFGLLRKHG